MIRIVLIVFVLLAVIIGVVFRSLILNSLNGNKKEELVGLNEVPLSTQSGQLTRSVNDLLEKTKTSVESDSAPSTTISNKLVDERIKQLETQVLELKTQVKALQLATPTPTTSTTTTTTSTKPSVVYIPMGTGGSITNTDWTSVNSSQVTIDPADFPGYTSMVFEVNMRLIQKDGYLKARLFNITDNKAVANGDMQTTSDTGSLNNSWFFTLPSGKKTYVAQFLSTNGIQGEVSYIRIRVNF